MTASAVAARCAAAASPPTHSRSTVDWRARPKEKESAHGAAAVGPPPATPPRAARLMALRHAVARASDWPPERKTTPGTAGGTVRRRARSVRRATSAGGMAPNAGCATPGRAIWGLRRVPSRATPYATSVR